MKRAWDRADKRRRLLDPQFLEKKRAAGRKAARRMRFLRPEYAAQWERDEQGRWYRAAQSADGSVTRQLLASLEAEWLCPYCAGPINDETREIDHIEPIARGGTHTAKNLAACCDSCNRAKGKLRLIEFLFRRITATA